MPKMQTCVTCTALQMVTTELRYECITRSLCRNVTAHDTARLHRQLRETRWFHVTRRDAGRRRTVRSPSLEESTLNVVIDRTESSIRTVSHHVNVSRHTTFVEG
ncbi:hypothetical protein TNCV_2588171 [Trichonephila clavipes]|nr:hypothetical protein TNCV_2588171 [Trichonephila clavipes]